MTKKDARAKLEKNGYKVVYVTSGVYIATKGQRSYKAETLNGLVNKIFR